MTVEFFTGFMIGAAVNAALCIAFMMWQEREEENGDTETTDNKTTTKREETL